MAFRTWLLLQVDPGLVELAIASPHIQALPVAPLLAEAIKRIADQTPVSSLSD